MELTTQHAFNKGDLVTYNGGARAPREWKGTVCTVLGYVGRRQQLILIELPDGRTLQTREQYIELYPGKLSDAAAREAVKAVLAPAPEPELPLPAPSPKPVSTPTTRAAWMVGPRGPQGEPGKGYTVIERVLLHTVAWVLSAHLLIESWLR